MTLTSDSWTNLRGDHIVTFVLKAPDQKPMFYKAINTTGIPQTGAAVADAISRVTDEVGADKIVSIITDNANVMQSAWKALKEKYPTMFAYGCAAHGVDLLVKDIVNLPRNTETIKDAAKIVQFINSHHMVHSKFD